MSGCDASLPVWRNSETMLPFGHMAGLHGSIGIGASRSLSRCATMACVIGTVDFWPHDVFGIVFASSSLANEPMPGGPWGRRKRLWGGLSTDQRLVAGSRPSHRACWDNTTSSL